MDQVLRFPGGLARDPVVDGWLESRDGELGAMARRWFGVMRECGPDVRELIHDGYPTACIGDAAFGYVGVFKAHVNVGFFRGAELPDPEGLMEGSGRFTRHVKLRPGQQINESALARLIEAAYMDMKWRLEAPGARQDDP